MKFVFLGETKVIKYESFCSRPNTAVNYNNFKLFKKKCSKKFNIEVGG